MASDRDEQLAEAIADLAKLYDRALARRASERGEVYCRSKDHAEELNVTVGLNVNLWYWDEQGMAWRALDRG